MLTAGTLVGIDLDNTLADYRRPLERLCADYGLPGPHRDPKLALREKLRSSGREAEWTRLQGELYGPLMPEAGIFPGATQVIDRLIASGAQVVVVSHRTKHPFSGPMHDLHAAAKQWLEAGQLGRFPVFLEETKEDKVERITTLGCSVFIDDLPEMLLHQRFPSTARKILFDPGRLHPTIPDVERASSWDEVAALLGV